MSIKCPVCQAETTELYDPEIPVTERIYLYQCESETCGITWTEDELSAWWENEEKEQADSPEKALMDRLCLRKQVAELLGWQVKPTKRNRWLVIRPNGSRLQPEYVSEGIGWSCTPRVDESMEIAYELLLLADGLYWETESPVTGGSGGDGWHAAIVDINYAVSVREGGLCIEAPLAEAYAPSLAKAMCQAWLIWKAL
jgi:hypothetical protein